MWSQEWTSDSIGKLSLSRVSNVAVRSGIYAGLLSTRKGALFIFSINRDPLRVEALLNFGQIGFKYYEPTYGFCDSIFES